MVETLMGQVMGKGKVADPTPRALSAGGGNPVLPLRRGAVVVPGGRDPDDEEKGLEISQTRVVPEDGTRDPYHSPKGMRTPRMTHNWGPCCELRPTAWEEEREPQGNPLPYSKTKNNEIYPCGCYQAQRFSAETVGRGKTSRNESNTP